MAPDASSHPLLGRQLSANVGPRDGPDFVGLTVDCTRMCEENHVSNETYGHNGFFKEIRRQTYLSDWLRVFQFEPW